MKAIFTYHSIDDSGSVISVHPDRFRAHLAVLHERRVPVLSIASVLDPECDAGVAITFDDGFENLADVAWPLLRERGMTATVFVATDWVGGSNDWDARDSRIPRLSLMDWRALKELAADGLEIGSHSSTHRRMTALAPSELQAELRGSRAVIEVQTGVRPTAFAYPYGDHDDVAMRAIDEVGYSWGLTTELRLLGGDDHMRPFSVPRVDAFYLAKPGVMEAWGSWSFKKYLSFRHAARRVRSTFGRTARHA